MVLPSRPEGASPGFETALYEFVDAYDRAYEAAAAEVGLSVAQACVLGSLEITRGMGALADQFGCDASNITQIAGRLEGLGLATREPDPADRRARRIARTVAGDAVVQQFEEAFAYARAAATRLTPDEQSQLTGLLRKAMGEPSPESAIASRSSHLA